MSRQSEAKEKQGYTKILKTCSNCTSFTCDSERSGYNKTYIIEKNLRCIIGGFKVNKMTTCNEHEFKQT